MDKDKELPIIELKLLSPNPSFALAVSKILEAQRNADWERVWPLVALREALREALAPLKPKEEEEKP